MQSDAQLRQDAVEALHYMQRVFGTSVTVVRVPCAPLRVTSALEELGLTVLSDCFGARVLRFPDDFRVFEDIHLALQVLNSRGKRCVRLDELLDEI